MKNSLTIFFALFAFILSMSGSLQAKSEAALKADMSKRLAQVVALKQNGSVGEDNRGFLDARSALNAQGKAVVNEENSDRREVYQIIADKTKTSAANVGKTRAASIRDSAPQGTWVQLPNGTWKKS